MHWINWEWKFASISCYKTISVIVCELSYIQTQSTLSRRGRGTNKILFSSTVLITSISISQITIVTLLIRKGGDAVSANCLACIYLIDLNRFISSFACAIFKYIVKDIIVDCETCDTFWVIRWKILTSCGVSAKTINILKSILALVAQSWRT